MLRNLLDRVLDVLRGGLHRDARVVELHVALLDHPPRFVSLLRHASDDRVAFEDHRARFVAFAQERVDFRGVVLKFRHVPRHVRELPVALEHDRARLVALGDDFRHRRVLVLHAFRHALEPLARGLELSVAL